MAVVSRLPLVISSGLLRQLPAGDRLKQLTITARATIKAGQLIQFDIINNGASLGDSDSQTLLGLACHDASSGNSLAVATSGILELASWSDAIGASVIIQGLWWFAGDTDGHLQTSQPSGAYWSPVGMFLSATEFEIKLTPSILLR